MRLIDADTLSEHKFQEVEFHGGSLNAAYRQGWNDAIDAIVENEPPVDAVPVKWIESRIQQYQDQNDAYSVMAAAILRTMVKEWKDETD